MPQHHRASSPAPSLSENMFNFGANPKVRGIGHIFLHVLRPLTIIGLLSVAVSSWVMIVMTGIARSFSFFDAMSHIFVSAFALALIASEADMFGIVRRYTEKNWPVFSASHSLGWLGLIMVVLGCETLSSLDKPIYSQQSLGMPLWRLILASGILAIAFGFINMLSSVIFRDGAQGITARQIRRDGNLAVDGVANKTDFYDGYSSRDGYSLRNNNYPPRSETTLRAEEDDMPATRRLTRMFNVKNHLRKSKIQISKPILAPQPGNSPTLDDEDFRHDRASPLLPSVQRPPTALHPAYTGGSRYSEAHMPRF